jgi:hypothetical protein
MQPPFQTGTASETAEWNLFLQSAARNHPAESCHHSGSPAKRATELAFQDVDFSHSPEPAYRKLLQDSSEDYSYTGPTLVICVPRVNAFA